MSSVVTVSVDGDVPVISKTPSSGFTTIRAVRTGMRRVIGKFGDPICKINDGGTLSGLAISEIMIPFCKVTFEDA